MPRLDVAGRRTTREEIYGSRERGHEVSRCERGGFRRLGWDEGTWLAAATTDGASLMEMEEDSCCGHGFISWSRQCLRCLHAEKKSPKLQSSSYVILHSVDSLAVHIYLMIFSEISSLLRSTAWGPHQCIRSRTLAGYQPGCVAFFYIVWEKPGAPARNSYCEETHWCTFA